MWTYNTPSLTTTEQANFASTAQLPSNLAPGTYYIGVWTDYFGKIDESNENNNADSIKITIKAPTQATSYSLTPASTTVTEGAGTLTFTITRSGGLPAETIYASTLFDTATSASGDYDPLVNKAISFAANQTSLSFTVHINQDAVVENTEHFRVMIGATTGSGSAQALDISDIYIQDDDTPAANRAPVVSGPATVNLSTGQTVAASTLFTSATDPDGSIATIRFWDSTPETGYFAYDGHKVTAGYIDVTPSQLSRLTYVTGPAAGKNDIVIEAFDNVGLDSNDLNVRINIAAATSPPTNDTVREGTDTQAVLQAGQTTTGKIDAEPIAGDGVTSDQQAGLVDKDWYRVTLDRGHLYTFSGSALTLGTGKIAIGLYDANGVSVKGAVEGGAPTFSFDTSGQSAASQTYYVAVSAGGAEPAWRTATGDYSIKYVDAGVPTAAPDDWADDPRDSGGPGLLTAGGNLAGTIERIGDYDYFTVNLTAGNTYHFSVASETRSSTGKIDTVALSLRSSTDFDTRLQSGGGLSGAGFDYAITRSGTYYVRVGAGSDASDIGGYRVSVGTGRATPVPAPTPTPSPSPSSPADALAALDKFLSDFWSPGLSAALKLFSDDDFWSSLRLILKDIGRDDKLAASNIFFHKLEKLAPYIDETATFVNISSSLAKGADLAETFLVEIGSWFAGALVNYISNKGPIIGFEFGGVYGGIVGIIVKYGGPIVWDYLGADWVRQKIDIWYDQVDDYPPGASGKIDAIGSSVQRDTLSDDSPTFVAFDESFYRASYPDVDNAIAQGTVGSAYSHFLTLGIDLGYRPNAGQTFSRTDLAIRLLNNDPATLGSSALFTLDLGALAGDGVNSGETAVALALANAAGAAHGAALDADLSAIAHRKALDLAVNASFDALAAASATNSSWALQWSDGSDFRQTFAGEFEHLLGANPSSSAYQLFVVPSSSTTSADVLARLQAQQGWSGSGFDTFGIAEYGGLWVVVVADRADSVATVAPGADMLEQISLYGSADSESLYAGLRAGRLFGLDGDDILAGSAGKDLLDGGAGNDQLVAGPGADQLYGGTGDDIFFIDGQADVVFENVSEGTDSVVTTGSYYLYANIERLFLSAGAGDIFGVGNELDNYIAGNDGANLLIAGAGDDIVFGGAGGDSLFGQDGADQIVGEAGVDYIVGGTGDDLLDGGLDADALYGEDGNDTLVGGTDFRTDILVGGSGDDLIYGNSGLGDYDRMDGGAGNDRYLVDTPADLTFEAAGGGSDTVYADITGAGYYLYANVENLVLLGATPFGVGNDLNNYLIGNAIGNYLLGGAGDDFLNGKAGNDVLFGEAGADVFVFEHGTGGDVIGDFVPGTDRIDLTAIGYSWAQVQNALHQNGGSTAIDLGGGDLVVLNGVTASQLHQSDFILAASAVTAISAEPVELTITEFQQTASPGLENSWGMLPV